MNGLFKIKLYLVYFFTFFFVLVSCSEESNLFPNSNPKNYFKHSTSVVLEVYYEPGAEPYEGNLPNSNPLWSITEDNISALMSFKSVSPTLTIPTMLSEMTLIPAQNKSTWDTNSVIALYKKYHDQKPSKSKAVFYIYFLNGNSSSGASVIAFSINSTPVIAVFKDVIESSSGIMGVRRFVEQSTIIHELGHAFGFVNNGVPMSSNHQDTDHGAHTQNTDCVMYWLNEGASDLSNFVQDYIATGNTVMWGPEVLADAAAFSD